MSFKKYLVPLATLIAAMPLANATVQTQPQQDKLNAESSSTTLNIGGSNSHLIGNLFQYSKGTELHALVVKPNENGLMLATHYSHSSHASHASHSSHFSSR